MDSGPRIGRWHERHTVRLKGRPSCRLIAARQLATTIPSTGAKTMARYTDTCMRSAFERISVLQERISVLHQGRVQPTRDDIGVEGACSRRTRLYVSAVCTSVLQARVAQKLATWTLFATGCICRALSEKMLLYHLRDAGHHKAVSSGRTSAVKQWRATPCYRSH